MRWYLEHHKVAPHFVYVPGYIDQLGRVHQRVGGFGGTMGAELVCLSEEVCSIPPTLGCSRTELTP